MITGGDGEFLISNREEPNFRKWHLLRAVVETLNKYPTAALHRQIVSGREATLLPHGLDLKIANVVLNETGKLYFVDLFGPKELDATGHWLSYTDKLDTLSEESLLAVCATREGALLRFYRLAEKLWHEQCGIEIAQLRQGFSQLLQSLSFPEPEKKMIMAELESDFSWLDSVYSERQV